MKRVALTALIALAALFALAACTSTSTSSGSASSGTTSGSAQSAAASDKPSWTQVDQETAKEMMARDDGHVIVDVRRQDEFDAGHIPGAIMIPNESIGTAQPAGLPDLDQIILIYCRSGNRSKEAAQKLADMGYTNVYEFGGIIEWTGEVVTDIDPDLMKPTAILVMEINGKQFSPNLENNSSADAFFEKLESGMLEVSLHDYGNFEKVGPLPWELPTNDEQITTKPGDIILYQGNQICIYYGENTWNFTKLASIYSVTRDELLEAFGDGDVTVRFWLEWTE